MDATIYINGQVAMSQQSGDKRYYENKLKRGKNIGSIIGKPSGRYSSAFNLFIYDEKLAQLDLQVVDQNENEVPYATTYFNDNKTGGFFNHDKNGKRNFGWSLDLIK